MPYEPDQFEEERIEIRRGVIRTRQEGIKSQQIATELRPIIRQQQVGTLLFRNVNLLLGIPTFLAGIITQDEIIVTAGATLTSFGGLGAYLHHRTNRNMENLDQLEWGMRDVREEIESVLDTLKRIGPDS